MFNKKMYLADFAAKEEAATRDGFGKALLELGKSNPKVVVLCADLAESTRTKSCNRCSWLSRVWENSFHYFVCRI